MVTFIQNSKLMYYKLLNMYQYTYKIYEINIIRNELILLVFKINKHL